MVLAAKKNHDPLGRHKNTDDDDDTPGDALGGSTTAGHQHERTKSTVDGENTLSDSKREAPWDCNFRKLVEYKKQNGHARVPRKGELGSWVNRMRVEGNKFKAGKPADIMQSRVDKLDAVGFDWNPFLNQWNVKLDLLEKYRQQNGHCRVPATYAVDGVNLGSWLQNQRQYYRKYCKGKPSHITQERIDQLKALGVDWNAQEAMWQSKFELLQQFQQQYGHCRVPANYKIDGVNLGTWINHQRTDYKNFSQGKTAFLTQERIDRLQALGLNFARKRSQERWQSKVELLRQYKQANGHCRVPAKYKTIAGVKLGQWLQNQRKQYTKRSQGKTAFLSQERINVLNAIDLDWTPRKRKASGDDGGSGSLATCAKSPHSSAAQQPQKSRKLNGLTVRRNLGENNNNDEQLPTGPSDSKRKGEAVV